MNILLGVGGGIAAYKACEIVRALRKRGDSVRVIMTRGAQEFVRPLTLQVLSENPVGTEIFDATYESEIGHIDLARWADVVLVAPATANLIGRLAGGLADDLLSTVILATRAPLVLAPSMNTQMWFHPLVQRNLDILRDTAGYQVITPDSGELACKEVGPGRLPDAPVLLQYLDRAVAPQILAGKSVVISAGPTREYIDPARFISNPSSGRMGYALARAAWVAGAKVTLVSGPTALSVPPGVRAVQVTSALQMHQAVLAEAPGADFVCMCAAVADIRPAEASAQKRAKSSLNLTLELAQNPDILAELGGLYGALAKGSQEPGGPFLIGFAAESHDVVERATAKRLRKGAHMIVANQIGGAASAFGAESSKVTIISAEDALDVGPATKEELAVDIWRVAANLAGAPSKLAVEKS
ncbi:bifunctional phosphopantothenoylcysteine decarboxylase/phosphopantothenate--cysteine ligase CoaBC [Bradymonas sediminis]|uniref:Coenzyme A biosynthesis bifunctional protein CoaBC n=1 Tax=Bradymonas sediminis TaxID=1548548 RepID=A0A2Z4FGJ5_9DELT|nr:bifunctional phosphopantothenoylcysteine decarboxylase/phosphopantothenate--cysteine ligase CoaBC [Bradymonas sediminis]AWV88101.1 bifunctional phosphopantothenoylcysteine decarboxylase/phosphopantothenate--cysteine ligase CoaBC [Bradymonas sediminis]TDP77224.1 phosphopantothenoylcysteine decarboxylase/phosphopantothenate--cysteine ligase [Bradymonas sediminis]